MCLFSVIVPVFNTKVEYLEKCINSVCSQSFSNYELVIVNDGSSEVSTNSFLENLNCLNKKNIKVLNQENKGVSTARNLGIQNSIGEYLLFLDADDFLNFDSFEKLSSVLEIVKYDILFFKYKTYYSKEKNFQQSEDNYTVCNLDSKEDILKEIIDSKVINENVNYGTPWEKLIKRELLIKNS